MFWASKHYNANFAADFACTNLVLAGCPTTASGAGTKLAVETLKMGLNALGRKGEHLLCGQCRLQIWSSGRSGRSHRPACQSTAAHSLCAPGSAFQCPTARDPLSGQSVREGISRIVRSPRPSSFLPFAFPHLLFLFLLRFLPLQHLQNDLPFFFAQVRQVRHSIRVGGGRHGGWRHFTGGK